MDLTPITAATRRIRSSLYAPKSVDAEMDKYARQAETEDTAKSKRVQPLQFILDLLQRGQYLTANMADEIEESFRTGRPVGDATLQVIKAAWEGVTGSRKGDWETLLFGGTIGGESEQAGERPGWVPQDIQEKLEKPLIHWGKEGATGLAEGALRPSKMIGLAANIAFDPLTYLTFGASKGATVAAGKYADDVVRLTLATMGPDDFAKIGVKFSEKVGKNIDDVTKIVSKSKIGSRWVEKIYKDAYQTALRNPEGVLLKEIAPRMDKFSAIETVMEPMAGGGARKLESTLLERQPQMQDLVSSIQKGYAGAGQRKIGSFMGKEFGVSERYPDALRQWDILKRNFETSKVGGTLGDAWWSVMNRGPIGAIKRAIGIRNPYQQILHLKERKIESQVHALSEDRVLGLQQALRKYDDDMLGKARDARLRAETIADKLGQYDQGITGGVEAGDANLFSSVREYIKGTPGATPTVDNLLGHEDFLKQLGIKPEEVSQIKDIWKTLDDELDKWWKIEQEATVAAGLPWDKTQRINYFPRKIGKGEITSGSVGRAGAAGTGAGGFLKKKAMTGEQAIENNANTFKFLMGDRLKEAYDEIPVSFGQTKPTFDDWVKQWVKDRGLTEANIDLKEALQLRAVDHAQYMGRMNMVQTFRQFGIPIDEAVKVQPELARQIQTFGEAISPAGIYKVNIPGLENYLFDSDTADILTKVGNVVSSDQSIKEFASLFSKGTAWWKGWVTMNPGFHARNAISNNITGFLKFGPRWFSDPEKIKQSIAISTYALHPDKYVDILKDTMNVSDGWVAKVLNGQVAGDFTGKELGDYVRSTGLVSKHSQVAEEIGSAVGTTLNPLSTKFKGFDISRTVGDAIENQSKVLSFLLDYDDLAKKSGQAGELASRLATQKQMLEYADMEAKKWFIDYGDLTQFEQKVMKKIIPFYTWIRKNLANQISGLALYPGMYSLIPKVRGAIKSDDDFDYSLLPDYMENMGYYPVGQTSTGGSILRWANIPLEDVNKIPMTFGEGGPRFTWQEILNDVAASAHPLIKTVIETMTGKDLFRQRDIKSTEKGPGVLQLLNKAPRVVQVLDGILRLAGFQGGMQITPTNNGTQLEMDGKLVKILENNVPVIRSLDNMLSNPEAIVEAIFPDAESMIEQISGKKDTQSALNEIFNIVSRTAGWKFKEIQMDEEEQRKQMDLLSRAEELRAADRKKLPGYQVRSAKALQARKKRAARFF